MQVRVLGCSGAIARDCRTTSFLVDDDLLVDAGTGVGDLSLEEMSAIDDVVLTHSHLDHVAALPLMLDAVASRRRQPLRVHALRATIEALRAHVFNNVIWPDFASIPSRESPFVSFHDLSVGQVLELGSRKPKCVEALPAVHAVPACGYAIRGAQETKHWVFSGDTERNPQFWQRINSLDVGMLVIETAFSNKEMALAKRSLHLCPAVLVEELQSASASQPFKVFITHTKPAETTEIMSEIGRTLATSTLPPVIQSVEWLQAGHVVHI